MSEYTGKFYVRKNKFNFIVVQSILIIIYII